MQQQRRGWRPAGERDLPDDEETSSYTHTQSRGDSGIGSDEGRFKGSVGPPPSYDGDRGAGVFEEYKLRAKLWLHSTNIDHVARGPRMLQALSGKAFEATKHLIEDDDWCNSRDNGAQLLKLLATPEYFGKEEIESLWNSMYRLFFSELRKSEDDLPAFRSRFEECVRKVKKHGVELPTEALGFLFIRQAKVDSDTLERLITITGGDLKLESVIDGMRRLKMRLMDDEDKSSRRKHLWLQESITQESHEPEPNAEPEVPEDDELILLEQALQDLEDSSAVSGELTEDNAKEVLMTLIKQKVTHPQNLNYRQVQQKKAEFRNARGFRDVHTGGNSSFSGGGGRTVRRDIEQLKRVTRCKSCGEVGHWHRECPRRSTSQQASASSNKGSGGSESTSHSWWAHVEGLEFSQNSTI